MRAHPFNISALTGFLVAGRNVLIHGKWARHAIAKFLLKADRIPLLALTRTLHDWSFVV
jgi:seryl-tRNA(Sec) selenium transferase